MGLFRKIVGRTSTTSKQSIITVIKFYSTLISPFLGDHCRFHPSCSLYARIAIERFGVWYGLWLSLLRILRCHPWHQDGYDPVPEKRNAKPSLCEERSDEAIRITSPANNAGSQ